MFLLFLFLSTISSLNTNIYQVTTSSSSSSSSSSSINVKLLLVLILGGIIWFVLTLYTIKKLLLSSAYFKCMSPLFDLLDRIILYIIKCGKTEQHIDNTLTIQNDIVTYQALPPKLSNMIAFLVITTITGIWVCTILAALAIDNWSSFIGLWMLIVCILYFGLWLYFKKQTAAENINNTDIKEVDYIKADILADIESTKVAMSEIPVELRDVEIKSKKVVVHEEDEETPSVL